MVIVAVVVVLGVGWYSNQYRPSHEIVVRVNDAEFDMNYYVKMLEYYGTGQTASYLYLLTDQVVRIIQQNELVRQGAMELGISVSDEAVDEELKEYDPPLSKDYRDWVRADMLTTKMLDEYFEEQVPVFAEQRHVLAMFLESQSQTDEVIASLESGENFAELAGELSLEDFSKEQEGDLGWRTEGIIIELLGSSVPEEYAFGAEAGVLSQPLYDESKSKPVGYWLVKLLERNDETEEVHLQAMLLSSQEEADAVKARLEGGEDFGDLAGEFSQHETSKEDGGDLDWLARDMMTSALADFAFSGEVELETLSEPIRDDMITTTGGYWLLKVVEIDQSREIAEEDRDLLKSKALSDWISALWDNPDYKIESYLDDQKKDWAVSRVAGD